MATTRFTVPPALAALRTIRDEVERQALAQALDDIAASLFALACVEAFTNIVRHARLPPGNPAIEIVIDVLADQLQVTLIHTGEAYVPPTQLPEVRLEDYPEGGFGLRIMRAASDEVLYLRGEHSHIVRLIKHLPRRER